MPIRACLARFRGVLRSGLARRGGSLLGRLRRGLLSGLLLNLLNLKFQGDDLQLIFLNHLLFSFCSIAAGVFFRDILIEDLDLLLDLLDLLSDVHTAS